MNSRKKAAIVEMRKIVKYVHDAMTYRQSFVFYSAAPTVGRHTILKRLDQRYDMPFNWRFLSANTCIEKEVFKWLSYSHHLGVNHVFRLTCSDAQLEKAKERLPYMRFIEIKSKYILTYDEIMTCMGNHNPC